MELTILKPNNNDYKIIRLTGSTNNRLFSNKLYTQFLKNMYFVISKQ